LIIKPASNATTTCERERGEREEREIEKGEEEEERRGSGGGEGYRGDSKVVVRAGGVRERERRPFVAVYNSY
jgi:hypothetical protein